MGVVMTSAEIGRASAETARRRRARRMSMVVGIVLSMAAVYGCSSDDPPKSASGATVASQLAASTTSTSGDVDRTTTSPATESDPSLAVFDVRVSSGIAQVSVPIPEGWDRDETGALAPEGAHSFRNDFALEGTCGGSCTVDKIPEHMQDDLDLATSTKIVVFDLDENQYESQPEVMDSIDDGLIQIRLVKHTYPAELAEVAEKYRQEGGEKGAAAATFSHYAQPSYEIYCYATFPDAPFYVYGHRGVVGESWKDEWESLSEACQQIALEGTKDPETVSAGDEVTIDVDAFGEVHQVTLDVPDGWEYIEATGIVPNAGGPYDGALELRIATDCNGSCDPAAIPDQLKAFQDDLLDDRSQFPATGGDEVMLPISVVDEWEGETGSGALALRIGTSEGEAQGANQADENSDGTGDLEFSCFAWDGKSDRFVTMRADSVPESALESFDSFAASCETLSLKAVEGP